FNDDGCSIMFSSQVSSSSVDLEIEDAVTEVEFDCIVSDGDADAKYVIAIRLMSRFFASLPNFSVHQHQQAFTVKLKSRWPWFFLREQQLLLFFQYATHLATKWRNHLLSSTAELRLGDQSISINHLYSIIDNAKFTKIDHGLTKSDINPKDRQNFSSCVKLTSGDLFKILKDNVDTQRTLIYLQVLKMMIMAYVNKKTTIAAREYAFLILLE
ncbi:unnamed protein product, partial [Rotaria socialis]